MARPIALGLAAALLAPAAAGARPSATTPPADTTAAVISALEAVCRPSTEKDIPPEVSVTRLGYPSVETPPNLPTGRPVRAWQAPAPGPGKLYVLEGGLPSSAQAGCVLALYGEALPRLGGDIQAQLEKDRTGFARNPTFSVVSPAQTIARFDRRRGQVVTSVTVLQPAAPRPDAPTAVVVVSRVDYGWMTSFGR